MPGLVVPCHRFLPVVTDFIFQPLTSISDLSAKRLNLMVQNRRRPMLKRSVGFTVAVLGKVFGGGARCFDNGSANITATGNHGWDLYR